MTKQFDLTDEQRQIQEMAQEFTAGEITPQGSAAGNDAFAAPAIG